MLHPLVYIFILLGVLFAAMQAVAVWAHLYYMIWWFDIIMHSVGGFLITLGLFAVAVVSWELFEQSYGLFNPIGYLVDTAQDMFLGISFGLLAYVILKKIVKIS
ncbi:hypothetical protein A2Z56_04120 [Candidatus Kaiserbacteria bacterium RIFCSPHIGHO2_12_45_16]|nr:MAG: hypothetical protein A2Z56_04120 [Candidatus Kaiserbacteria bacterium RIFCSPHIGHO2_12_45_16]